MDKVELMAHIRDSAIAVVAVTFMLGSIFVAKVNYLNSTPDNAPAGIQDSRHTPKFNARVVFHSGSTLN